MGMNLHLKHRIIPIWVVLSCLSLVLAPMAITASRTHPPLSSIDDPTLPTEKNPPFSQIPTENKAHSPEIKVIHHEDLNMKILVALIVASTLLVGILLFLLCCWIFKQRHLKPLNTKKIPKSQDNNVRVESCGNVYKARFNDHFFAAVKRLHSGGEQHDARKGFENEVDWLGKLKHQNIVNLFGYCVHDDTRFLVYEMMHQGSLESQLHGPSHGRALTWHRRMQVALDIARGLEYLHERCNPPVIHRDLRSSNILLDSNFTAKISNFALATTELHAKNKVKLSGASGYVAPEYLSEDVTGKLTDKSDVYAFGVVLLELLIGRKPVEKMSPSLYQSIVTWAIPQLTDRSKLPHVVDPVIRDTMDLKHLYQVAAVAVLCVQPEPSYRPLITDVLHSFIPLVPVDLGGSLRS
ncbi:probable receptor-like protein kinase At1g80640 isoform X5 [Helianthus annuus]|uniref:probable receptor-like protein kinase At1g80640 isoform X5 n=1 Tax=Helianthus annuus TaxID=4232 RepID=UPI0016532E07|nr:probable receptor-like protein kinase At1g80640 isoform X5 [Helianthus annuus]